MAIPRASKRPDFLAALLRDAYFPKELPPAFTTKQFADFCKTNFEYLRSQQDSIVRRTTNYDTFTAPRDKSGRRNLALVHPIAQLGVSLLITQHRKNIKQLIGRSGTSLYRTDEDIKNDKAFLGLDFRKRTPLAAQLSSEFPFILQADISRFFYTAYTHSIPWAVVGKEKVKEWLQHDRKRLNGHWSNKFDAALQSCQSRETFGIPVGPDTSRIIAEVLLSGIEADATLAPLLKKGHAFRLLDDFTMGFMTEGEARQALGALRNALWKYNLQLNDEKTKIIQSQLFFREKWQLEFDRASLSRSQGPKQVSDIHRLVDLALNYCSETRSSTPAIWACRRLSRIAFVDENLGEILDALFRLARDFPICVSYVAVFLINNQEHCSDIKVQKRVRSWITHTLSTHLPDEHHFEVAWCLLVAGVLRMRLEKKDIPVTGAIRGSVVFALLAILRERNLLDLPLSAWNWRAELRREGEYGPNWLPFYEAVRRGWTTDLKIVNAVKKEPILSRALAANVSFIEDRVFTAGHINLTKRVFQPKPTDLPARAKKSRSKFVDSDEDDLTIEGY